MRTNILGLLIMFIITLIGYFFIRFHLYSPLLFFIIILFVLAHFAIIFRKLNEDDDSSIEEIDETNVSDMEFYVKNRDKIKEMEEVIKKDRESESNLFYKDKR